MISRNAILFYSLAGGALVVDQGTKAIAHGALSYDRPVTVIPGFFDLRLSHNSGAAFGAMPNWASLFIIIALVAVYAIVRLRKASEERGSLSVGLGLLLGGALGNLVDRLVSPAHEVTDFLSCHIRIGGVTRSWPTFNIADAAIVVGALTVFFAVYVVEKRRTEDGGE